MKKEQLFEIGNKTCSVSDFLEWVISTYFRLHYTTLVVYIPFLRAPASSLVEWEYGYE